MPYKTIFHHIREIVGSDVDMYTVYPADITLPENPASNRPYQDFDDMCKIIERVCADGKEKFILSYCV